MKSRLYICNFCGKNQHEVAKIVAGPDVCICDECTRMAWEIINLPSAGEIEYQSWFEKQEHAA